MYFLQYLNIFHIILIIIPDFFVYMYDKCNNEELNKLYIIRVSNEIDKGIVFLNN